MCSRLRDAQEVFYDKFYKWGAQVSNEHKHMPNKRNEEELNHVQSFYEGKGLLGCVGFWYCCPASMH